MMAATIISTVDRVSIKLPHGIGVGLESLLVSRKLMSYMNDFGLITAETPKGVYRPMTDVIHKVLNDITVDDWDVIIGGLPHADVERRGVCVDSGTVALALATGEATMPIPQSVKVTFKGALKPHMTSGMSSTQPRSPDAQGIWRQCVPRAR